MAISAVADDAFEGRVDRAGWLGVDRALFRDRAVELTDHERYEADWPSIGRGSRDQDAPPRSRRRVARR
jgi:hypothetical protein